MRTLQLVLIFLPMISFSQTVHEVISSSSGDASGSGGSVAYSVGQIVYTTNTGATGSVAQGVEQAFEISSIGIIETDLSISLQIYPNPTSDFLTLKVQDYNNENLSYELFDEQGKLLSNEKVITQETQVAMSSFPRAIYFMNVSQENPNL